MQWSRLWNPELVPKVEWLEGHPAWNADLRQEVAVPTLTCEEIRQIVRANKKRAPGVDGWAPKHWSLLPVGFYDDVAALWNTILQGRGDLPQAWLDVRVVPIPKEDSEEMRPLIVCVCWRGGPV